MNRNDPTPSIDRGPDGPSGTETAFWMVFEPRPAVAVAVLCLLSIPLIFIGLDTYSAVNGDEVNYQMMALTMVRTGDWFTLANGSQPRVYDTYMNAPLQYWWRAIIIELFGNSLWAMRIHSALFGLATVLMTYRLVHYIRGRRAAFLAALILLTTFQFLFLHSARTGETETPLLFLFVCAAYLFIRAEEDPNRGWILHHACFAGILNLKIPVVLIPTAAEFVCFALSAPARRQLKSWFWTGVATIPFGLSWHLYQAVSHPDQFVQVFGEMGTHASNVNRLGQSRGGLSNLRRYAPVILFGTFPYVLFYPIAIVSLMGEKWRGIFVKREYSVDSARIRTLVVYGLAVFVFYIVVAKRGAWYLMPAYPFLAALLGIWLAGLPARRIGNFALAYLAIAASLLFWLKPEMSTFNPFSRPALSIPMRTEWRSFVGSEAIWGVSILAALLFTGLHFARRRWGTRFASRVAAGIAVVLIGYAGVRDVIALQYIGYESPFAKLRREIDARIAAGERLDYPLAAPRGQNWILRYYFWEDFVLRRGHLNPESGRPLDPDVSYLLYERRQIREEGKKVPLPRFTDQDLRRLRGN